MRTSDPLAEWSNCPFLGRKKFQFGEIFFRSRDKHCRQELNCRSRYGDSVLVPNEDSPKGIMRGCVGRHFGWEALTRDLSSVILSPVPVPVPVPCTS